MAHAVYSTATATYLTFNSAGEACSGANPVGCHRVGGRGRQKRHFTVPIAAKGRIFVAADDTVLAFTP